MIVEMTRCEKCGSFYNKAKTDSCPYCAKSIEETDDDKTMAVSEEMLWDDDKTMAVMEDELYPKTEEPMPDFEEAGDIEEAIEPEVEEKAEGLVEAAIEEECKTVAPTIEEPIAEPVAEIVEPISQQIVKVVEEPVVEVSVETLSENVDPAVGWLVCISGNMRGKEYRIHSENNFIGRSSKMDICVPIDEKISDENHAILTYDDRDRKFYFALGEGRGIVRLNGTPLLMASELKAYDRIELGNTEFLFIPLCGENFSW